MDCKIEPQDVNELLLSQSLRMSSFIQAQPTLSGLLKDPGAEHEEVGIFESLSFAFFILHDVLDGSEGLLLVHTV